MIKNISKNLFFIKNIRHNSTIIPWKKQLNITAYNIIGANGPYIYTNNGNSNSNSNSNDNGKIIDFTSGAMVVNLGHNNKYIQDGFNNHIKDGIAYVPSNFNNNEKTLLSDRLLNIANFDNGKVFYSNAGGDANEIACFLTQEYHSFNNPTKDTKKIRILSFENSFHGGSTIGSSLLSGDKRCLNKGKYYNMPLESIMKNPSLNDNGDESLEHIKQLFLKDDISAIIVEGSSGSAGCILYPDNYLKKLEKMCKDNDILLICDEVMSGFGRTGTFFAHTKHNITPDIITCAKGITSGYIQLGAVLLNNNISRVFDNNSIMCGLTYSGHPLACNIANRCLDLYLENDMEIIKNVNVKSDIMRNYCLSLVEKHKCIKEYRNNGLLGCFDLNITDEITLNIIDNMLLENGIYCMRIRNNLFTAPPLNIDNNIVKDGIDKIDNIMRLTDYTNNYNYNYKYN